MAAAATTAWLLLNGTRSSIQFDNIIVVLYIYRAFTRKKTLIMFYCWLVVVAEFEIAPRNVDVANNSLAIGSFNALF